MKPKFKVLMAGALFFIATNTLISQNLGNTNVGNGALQANTTGNYNSAMGDSALFNNTTGRVNSAMGYSALAMNTTGSANSAMGSAALLRNTTGSRNSAMGYSALGSNTTGYNNSAMGQGALQANTTGSRNSAMGQGALYSNTRGDFNSAMGNKALYGNTNGLHNSAMGYQALYSNFLGSRNSAMGNNAMYSNTSGGNNSAMGNRALYSNTSGENNSAMGSGALNNNTLGSRNSAMGYAALLNNTEGSGNVAIGYEAGYNETGSNKLYIANSQTSTPLIYGDFAKESLVVNGTLEIKDKLKLIGDGANTPTIDAFIDGTVVFGGEDGSVLTDSDINSEYYAHFAVWVEHGIVTEDIAIAPSANWAKTTPDYVFEADYKLPTLNEVESYVQENGHLEGVPSKAEITERGWSLPKMDQTLLKKVEELTLYTIEQEKQIQYLKMEVSHYKQLADELRELKMQVKNLLKN